MEKVSVYQRPCGPIGIVRSSTIRNHPIAVDTSSIIVQMPHSSGSITSSSVDSRASSFSVLSLTMECVYGSALLGYQRPFTLLALFLDSVNMMPMLMTTSTSLIEHSNKLFYAFMDSRHSKLCLALFKKEQFLNWSSCFRILSNVYTYYILQISHTKVLVCKYMWLQSNHISRK